MVEFTDLIGKTIVKVDLPIMHNKDTGEEYDDRPYLQLTMSDGTEFVLIAQYKEWTGKSIDEYRRVIAIGKN